MMAGLSPRLRWALAVALALTVFAALQPAEDDGLTVDRPAQREGASGASPIDQSTRSGSSRSPSASKAAPPTVSQASELALLSALWDQRGGVAAGHPATTTTTITTTITAAHQPPGPWASQQPPPPPAPPPVAVVMEAPQAPRFPYHWVGRYVDEAPRAVIAGPSQTWVLRQGDVLEGQWRVDAIGERQMTIMYLPLEQSQAVGLK